MTDTEYDQYFRWLSQQIPSKLLLKLEYAYREINSYFHNCGMLEHPLFQITDLQVLAEIQTIIDTDSSFYSANKCWQREMSKAIQYYIDYRNTNVGHKSEQIHLDVTNGANKITVSVVHSNSLNNLLQDDIIIQDTWIRFDGENGQDFARTFPAYVLVGGEDLTRENWHEVLIALCEKGLRNHPEKMAELAVSSLMGKLVQPFLLRECLPNLSCVQISNGYWINVNLNIPSLLATIYKLARFLDYSNSQIIVYGMPKSIMPAVDMTELHVPLTTSAIQQDANKSNSHTFVNEACKAFSHWMLINGMAEGIVNNYASALTQISEYAKQKNLTTESLWAITSVAVLKHLAQMLTSDIEFAAFNVQQNYQYSAALQKYIDYRHTGVVDEFEPICLDVTADSKPSYQGNIDVQDTWIRFNGENSQDFARTFPAYVLVGKEDLTRENWRKVLIALCEKGLRNHPEKMAELTVSSLTGKMAKPFLLRECLLNLDCTQISDGHWININFNIPSLLVTIYKLALFLGYSDSQIIIYGMPKDSSISQMNASVSVGHEEEKAPQNAADKSLYDALDRAVRAADLQGITPKVLALQMDTTVVAVNQMIAQSPKIITIGSRLIHEDVLVDWKEAQAQLDRILDKAMTRDNGYTSAVRLYKYVHAEMQMFLNDHDLDSAECVYDLARHLFEKNHYQDKTYRFTKGIHISRENIVSVFDLAKHFAASYDGFFRESDLEEYLQGLGNNGSVSSYMQIGKERFFFYYDDESILTADAIGIDKAWLKTLENALQKLFDDVGDHIPLRHIEDAWYRLLPELPQNLVWNGVLLQNILACYGKQLHARTISATMRNVIKAEQAMLVSDTSEVQTFCDAVIASLVDRAIEQRKFTINELRKLLIGQGLIGSNQLTNDKTLQQSLADDHRFLWDLDDKNVTIRL